MNIDIMEMLTRKYTYQLHVTGRFLGTGMQRDGIELRHQEKPNGISCVSHPNKI